MGPWKISPRRHARDLAALARSWPRHSLPAAEGAVRRAWGQDGAVGKRGGRRRGPLGGFRGFRTAKRARIPLPAPSGPCALPAPARSRPRAPGAPCRPLVTAAGPFLSGVVSEGQQRLVLRKGPVSNYGKQRGSGFDHRCQAIAQETKFNTSHETGCLAVQGEKSNSHLLLYTQVGGPRSPLQKWRRRHQASSPVSGIFRIFRLNSFMI